MVMMMTGNLHFVLLKINDTDICQLQQEQRDVAALGRLLTENPEENVVLQLKRKAGYWASKSTAVGDNEETEISKRICYLKIQQNVDSDETLATNVEGTTNNDGSSPAPKPMEIIMNLYFPNTVSDEGFVQSKSTQTDDMAYYVHEQLRNIQKDTERLIEEEHNLFEQSLAPEIDIEEITLRKTHSHERLGLTVCYSNGEEYGESGVDGGAGSGGSGNEVYGGSSVTEVYISDIHADSVAGRDGRLRQGDQILQINGKDITTREETETLIAENNNAVTLLVSRYLYGEDDFNDPSTNEDDDEVLVVEDDEDDDDEEYYDENNMTYVNCMTNNDCCLNNVDDFDKALLSQVEQQHQEPTNETIEPAANNMPKEKTKIPKNDRKTSSMLRQNSNSTNLTATATNVISNMDTATKSISSSTRNAAENKTSDYYESEHIYETIPEDPESEPFYCSPYDSSVYVTAIASCSSSTMTDALQHQMQQHKQRVVQWLGINPSHGICHTALPRHAGRNTSGGGGRSLKSRHKISSVGTMRSTVTSLTNGSSLDGGIGSAMTLPASQVDDQDNSSSAYNTGGSNNSVSPHSVVLTGKLRGPDVYTNTPSGVPSLAATTSTDDVMAMQQILMQQHKLANQTKILSPKDKNKITSPKSANKLPFVEQSIGIGGKSSGGITYNSNDTTNIQRSSMVQQHLIKQSPLSIDKIGAPQQLSYYQHQVATNNEQMHCPQFTAPNLSQYHFVSSQEVNNLSLNNKIPKSSPTVAETAASSSNVKKDGEEEAMVWKVKRRPDGTRYIVRRPAKSRVIKERSVRLNVERLRDDVTTTEDDTMSEIKTGRYWTREERKKHIEKAKERRQQQQMQYQQQLQQQLNKTADATVTDNQPHFLSFSRQKYRQHYQLQFNTAQAEAAAQKHKSSLNYSSQASNNLHDDGSTCGVGAVEQSDNVTNMSATVTVNPTPGNHMMAATSNERNNLNSNMVSVTTV
ncbi:slo-interacting protein 1-like [Musca domestica]|uniref:Slo-interacting protein 1-like n=1 Tax=Musca domestica TaxID=7370 RepID=A0A1I8NG31_MUSDO|nr:slo-interacting protein 1-like [Musca domestica]